MSAEVTGWINSVSFMPGRRDAVLTLYFNADEVPKPHLLSLTDESSLTIDGRPASAAELLAWLLATDAEVTIFPLAERYTLSLRGDFRGRR
jgi:hypothetical protein